MYLFFHIVVARGVAIAAPQQHPLLFLSGGDARGEGAVGEYRGVQQQRHNGVELIAVPGDASHAVQRRAAHGGTPRACANEADENTVRRDSVPIDYDDLFATQKGESRMPSLKQHFFTRAFLDADLERRYQRGRFRYWKVQMFKTATMMTVAITYQTIVVVFKLRSLLSTP